MDTLARVDPRLRPAPAAKPIEEAGPGLAPGVRDGWGRFLVETHGDWRGFVDRRTGRLEFAEGSGIPWLPGRGNHLSLQDLALDAGAQGVDLGTLESIARAFLPKVAPLLGIDPASLALNRGRSGQLADYLWLVDFDVRRGDLAIEGARVVFRVNHGNLVQFGSENLPPAGAPVPRQKTDRRDALAALSEHIQGFSAADTFLDSGSLHLVSLAVEDSHFAEGFEPGKGRALGLVWDFVFRRKGVTGTWRGRVDATSGEVLVFQDLNAYGQAKGGAYPESYIFGGETVLPMPYADLSTGGFANAAGRFSGTGPVSSTLSGQYVRISDTCGPISMSSDVRGILNFGTSSGTNCTTPGAGGGGNTHASRTQFYHVNRIKELGRGWLPGNSWLNGQLTANVNLNQTCNAYWNGTTLNFFKSGGGCGNTGEIAAVALHEYGHGLDSNDGNGFSSDNGTGEAYADITAALQLHTSCMGPGFLGGNCGGYGDACTACTGVRDLDWAKHVSNVPHTVANFTQNFCFGSSYSGPCGREGHCESQIATEAVWDLAARDLPNAGSAAAWAVVERLWYLSRPTATSAFTCTTTTSPWTSNGCSAGSLWRTMRAVDDDDGNLTNGTPHSCALFAAFNRHGIACAADPGASVCFSACAAPTVPALTLTAGNNQVQVDWTSSGDGVVYDLYRSEVGCNAGFIKIASDLTGTSLNDTAVANGLTYSYQLIAHPSGSEACSAAPSTCQSAAPVAPPCGAVPAPTGVTATAAGLRRINLSWDAVPTASAYLVFRSTTAGGPYTEVGSVAAPATAFADTGLADGTTYYYVVHAFAGDCESGDSQAASATTDVCHPFTLYSNDFESGSGLADWTAESLIGGSTADWRGIQACTAHSGTKIFRFGGSACNASYADFQRSFAQPQGPTGIVVPPGGAETRLSFWHRWSFEFGFDGGTLMLSVDGGNAITIPASAIVAGATYNASSYLTNQPIFTSTQDSFVNTTVDLDAACNLATGGTGGCGGHTLSIRFTTIIDSSVTYPGWFLDDVAVTLCGPNCTAPATPAIGAATTPADNQIQVSWSNGAPAASKFNVYRAAGTCAAAGSFAKRASLVSGLSYLDSPISGGLTFAYRVTGTDATGFCESPASACVDATATGPCLYAPIFAGLQSAGDTGQSTCTLNLAWQAATPTCGSPVTYNVYRSTSPGFTPGPGNLVAQGVSGTSYNDAGALVPETTYYYIVRAVHGPAGQEDGNTVRRSAKPTGPLFRPGTLTDTFEGARSGGGFDRDGWTHAALHGGIDWTWYDGWSQSPSHSWRAPQYGFTADQVLVSPVFTPQAGTTLSFWHYYNFEPEFDGGTLEISTDGATWTVLPDAAFTAGGFTHTLIASTNPIAGKRGWSDFHDWTQVQVDLSAWAGSTVRVRWHAGEDRVYGYYGWWIDSVTIANAIVGGQCDTVAAPLSFYTVTPCRLLDTRNPVGPLGGPALQPGGQRTFALTGLCNVPLTAKALSVNMTVTQPAAGGYLILFPEGEPVPAASSISFSAGQTRANNGVLKLNDGATRVFCSSSGPVHLILDVNGYFE